MIKYDTFEKLVLGLKYFRAEEGNKSKYYWVRSMYSWGRNVLWAKVCLDKVSVAPKWSWDQTGCKPVKELTISIEYLVTTVTKIENIQ